MKITMEATSTIVEGHGRVWRGVTGAGVPCLVVVRFLGSESDADLAALQPELATLEDLGRDSPAVLIEMGKGAKA